MSNITFKGLKKVDTSSPVSITASNGDIIKAYPSGHSVTPSISVGRTNLSYGDAGGGVPVSIPKSGGGMVTAYPASSLPQPVQNDVSKPIYSSQYSGRVAELLDAISGYKPFSYDMETDPLFKQYRKQYLREGKRATEDTMGSFAGMTGGIPSSYAVTAAAQAGNYYNSQLNDRLPELYQLAYNQYLDDYNRKLDELDIYMKADEVAYGRHRDDVSDWYDDRQYNRDVYESDRDYQFDVNKYSDEKEYNDWYRDYQERQFAEEIAKNNREETLNKAEVAASYKNYELLKALGIDTTEYENQAAYDRAYEYAMAQAENGDFAPAEALGLNVTELKRLWSLGILTEEQGLRNAGYTGDVRADSNALAASLLPAPVNDNGSDAGVGAENGVTDNAIVKYDNISGNYYNAAGQVVGNDGKVRYYADANTNYIFDKDGNIATYSQYSDPNAVIIWPEMLEKNASIGDNGGRQSAVTPIPDGYQYGDALGSGTPTNYVPAVEDNYVPVVEENYVPVVENNGGNNGDNGNTPKEMTAMEMAKEHEYLTELFSGDNVGLVKYILGNTGYTEGDKRVLIGMFGLNEYIE